MTDLIQRLVESILRQEGMGPGAVNPGNLRCAPWKINPVIRGGFWQPSCRAEGLAGVAHCVALRIAEGQSLAQLISAWAPASENNTAAYLKNVKSWAGIQSENQPLWDYL